MAFRCIRCGYCCISQKVIIIKPEHINSNICPEKTMDFFNKIIEKPPFSKCPYLTFNKDGISFCKVHNKEWYSYTTCGTLNTFLEHEYWHPDGLMHSDEGCRIGNYVRKNFPKNWWMDWWVWMPSISSQINV